MKEEEIWKSTFKEMTYRKVLTRWLGENPTVGLVITWEICDD